MVLRGAARSCRPSAGDHIGDRFQRMSQLLLAGTADDRLQFPVRADDRVAGQPEDVLPDLPFGQEGVGFIGDARARVHQVHRKRLEIGRRAGMKQAVHRVAVAVLERRSRCPPVLGRY